MSEKAKKFPRWIIVLIIVLAAAAVLAGLYIWFCFNNIQDEIYQQTFVNGIDITGMTVEEAKAAVQEKFEEEYRDAAYEVVIGDETWTIPVFPLLSIDADECIEDAYALCHGEWYTRGYEYLKNQYSPEKPVSVEILPETGSTDDIQKTVKEIAKEIDSPAQDSTWSYDGNTVSIQTGVHGESVDADKIYREIVSGLENGEYSGTVKAEPDVTKPGAVDPKEIAEAVYVAPKDAAYEYQDGQVIVTPSAQGEQISEEEIAAGLSQAEEGSTLTFEKSMIEPGVREETLQSELFRDVIAEYDVVDGGSPTQKTNQGLACSAINETILMPNEVFSFNNVVGDTTPEKGYVEDYAYNEGRLVTEYGGGVCRVASTLYAAVLGSNLEIVLRYNHSSPVHYLPLGMDATVSYPAPDLQFKNNQGHPIKILMRLENGVVHAEILGTKAEEDPYVEVQLNPLSDKIVETFRLYYDQEGGELQEKEYISTSVYKDLIYDDD